MPDLHSLVDRLYYANRREYTESDGKIAYLDGTPLNRPLSMPASQKALAAVIVVAAIAIGALFFNQTVLSTFREAMAADQAIADSLSREPSINTVPVMKNIVKYNDDNKLKKHFEKEGYVIFDATELSGSDDMVLYKLPADVDVNEAAGMLGQGVNSLDAAQATKLLNGSWYFSTQRMGATSMVVRYADFSTSSPQQAISTALDMQGFDPTTISESGEDDSGNTYSMGTVEVGKKTYTWKISALPLFDMYSIKNLPEDACYVGVRLTAQ